MRSVLGLTLLAVAACGGPKDSASTGDSAATTTGAPTTSATSEYLRIRQLILDYAAEHPGSEGDVNGLSEAEVLADADAQELLALCGADQRPVIPLLAWEYGGNDHAWIHPNQSALVYCVYTPVAPSTDHWDYAAAADRVTADLWVLFPDENPCNDQVGAAQVLECIGDDTNFEILVDTASYNDGVDVGLNLSEASTELILILEDGSEVHLLTAM